MRFEVNDLDGVVTRATLRLYVMRGGAGLGVKPILNQAWHESEVSWSSRPDTGETLDSLERMRPGRWVSLDVTGFVTANGGYGFMLSPRSSDILALASAEWGGDARRAPRLVLVTE